MSKENEWSLVLVSVSVSESVLLTEKPFECGNLIPIKLKVNSIFGNNLWSDANNVAANVATCLSNCKQRGKSSDGRTKSGKREQRGSREGRDEKTVFMAARSARCWPFGTFDDSDNYRSEARTMPLKWGSQNASHPWPHLHKWRACHCLPAATFPLRMHHKKGREELCPLQAVLSF